MKVELYREILWIKAGSQVFQLIWNFCEPALCYNLSMLFIILKASDLELPLMTMIYLEP
jgi:hypothetical protein